jgi:hypothetical protein
MQEKRTNLPPDNSSTPSRTSVLPKILNHLTPYFVQVRTIRHRVGIGFGGIAALSVHFFVAFRCISVPGSAFAMISAGMNVEKYARNQSQSANKK